MLSVIICSHNPRKQYLDQAITALKAQTLRQSDWEIVIVDNASDTPISTQVDLAWHPRTSFVSEPSLGLTSARLTGIANSSGELLVFVDDDNLLDPSYLERAVAISRTYPHIGAFGGQCIPQFEAPPPAWTRPFWGMLALRSLESDLWSNLPATPATMPFGAGMCVLREVASSYASLQASGRRAVALDRVGSHLLSGGDNDLAACALDIGMGQGVFQSLVLKHCIPRNRTELEYLKALAEGVHFSGVLLYSMRGWPLTRSNILLTNFHWYRTLLQGPAGAVRRSAMRGTKRGFRYIARIPTNEN